MLRLNATLAERTCPSFHCSTALSSRCIFWITANISSRTFMCVIKTMIHREDLMADWRLAVGGQQPHKIEPLK
jgi:hypothetical protein